MLRVKICGITQLAQGRSIASYGATDLGFICVAASPRYVSPANLQMLVPELQSQRLASANLRRLSEANIEQIFQSGLHEFISSFIDENNALGAAITDQYQV